MKPAAFDYYRPASLDEALQLLNDYGEEGKVIAGGQSFIPILNMRLSAPECLIDINQLKELDYIKIEEDWLKIGTLTRQTDLEQSLSVQEKVPFLVEAARYIGHVQTRNRGTVGGSLVHADPSAELPLAFLTLEAKALIRSVDEERLVDVADFFLTYLTVDMMPNELLTEIQIPLSSIPKGYAFVEFSQRHGDFALVAAACLLDTDVEERITACRLAIGGIGAVPMIIEKASNIVQGQKLSEELIEQLSECILEHADPDDDLHASREYRIHLARVLTKRSLVEAYNRAIGKGDIR